MHGVSLNPPLPEVEAETGHQKQAKTADDGRKHRAYQGTDGGPNHDHGHRQSFSDGLLGVNGQLRGRVWNGFLRGLHGEQISDFANGRIAAVRF